MHNTRISSTLLPPFGTDLGSETAVEVVQLITQLTQKLGVQGYCVWLANYTPVEWLTVTPYNEIRDTLAVKLQEMK